MLVDSRLVQFEDIRHQLRYRALLILGAVIVTAIGARLTIPLQPVPITFQVLAVLLTGLLLSPLDAAIAQTVYVGLIALGLPLDAQGLGTTAFFGPTGGYLVSFIIAAALVAWLSGLARARGNWLRWVAALLGIVVIYLVGASWLAVWLNSVSGLAPAEARAAAWAGGVAPFIVLDSLKAGLAVLTAEAAQRWLGINRG